MARGPGAQARALELLRPAERARHARFRHDADRQMFLLGRVMARTIVGEALGESPDDWPWREGPRGRPEIDLPGLRPVVQPRPQRRTGRLRDRTDGSGGRRCRAPGPGATRAQSHPPLLRGRRGRRRRGAGRRLARPLPEVLDAQGVLSEGASGSACPSICPMSGSVCIPAPTAAFTGGLAGADAGLGLRSPGSGPASLRRRRGSPPMDLTPTHVHHRPFPGTMVAMTRRHDAGPRR